MAASTKIGPDDKKAVFAVWNAQEGSEIHRGGRKLTTLAFSPKDELLGGGDEEGVITVWSMKHGKLREVAELKSGRPTVLGLAFGMNVRRGFGKDSDEGAWLLAAGHAGGTVTIWDLRTKQLKMVCPGCNSEVRGLAFSLDGAILATADRYQVKLWDVAMGRPLLDLPCGIWLTGVAFSPDGKTLAASGVSAFDDKGQVKVWKLDHGRGVQTLYGLSSKVFKVAFSPDGRHLAALSDEWKVAIWDLARGYRVHLLDVPKGYAPDNAGMAFSPDGQRFAFASGTRAGLWDLSTGRHLEWRDLKPGLNDHLTFDSTSKKLILARVETEKGELPPRRSVDSGNHPRVVRVFDLLGPTPEKPLLQRPEFKDQAYVDVLAPDGSFFSMTGVTDKAEPNHWSAAVLDSATGKELWSLPRRELRGVPRLCLDPTGKAMTVATSSRDNTYAEVLVELPSGRHLESLGPGFAHCPGPGGDYMIDRRYPYRFYLSRRSDRTVLVRLNLDTLDSSVNVLFDRAGTRVAWGNRDGTVTVFDLEAVRERLAEFGLGW